MICLNHPVQKEPMSIRVQVDALWNFKAVMGEAKEAKDTWREKMLLKQAGLAWSFLLKEVKDRTKALSFIGN